jgi:two-component system, cell cycle sensor histidine kinase and response regulator CckA
VKGDILIVEDSPTQAAQLRYLLAQAGHEVLVANDGERALAVLAEQRSSLVITDIVMPNMDGYTLCKNIKADSGLSDIPVILLTSLSSPQDVLKGLTCGADNFIRKPYEEKYLLQRVSHVLTNAELRKREKTRMGMEISFAGERHFITSERQQIVDFLISSFEEAVHLNGELTRSYRSLDGLYRIAEGLNRCTSEREVTAEALERALDLPGVQAAWILVHEGARGLQLADIRSRAGVTIDRDLLVGDTECRRRLHGSGNGGPVNLPECDCLGNGTGHASVPLLTGNRLVGLMNLIGPEAGEFADEDLRTLNGVGNQVAAALERALLQEHLERRVEERTAALTDEIGARRRAEEALQALVAIVESSDDAMVRMTPDGVVATWNPGAERLYGYVADDAVGRSIDLLAPPERIVEMAEIRRRVLAGESIQGYENTRVTKDGRDVEVSLTLSPVRDRTGGISAIAEITRDITASKELERQFLQAQKMESVGRLAGGIAHDFNNLMTAVIGFSELMLARMDSGDANRDHVAEIKRSGERAAALTQQLLAFGRRQVQRPVVLDLNAVVSDLQTMLDRLIGDDIDLCTTLTADPWSVKMDRSHLEQVVMNLAINARDAMPRGGKLTIETANIELDEEFASKHFGAEPGCYVLVLVSDTGIGMDEDTKTRIFEPFYTTKEEGTGLGLSTVFGIVKQSNGHVWVDSVVGEGSTFRVYLPRTEERAALKKPLHPGAAPAGGSETVLVVEDEEGVRELVRELLQEAGYTVLAAGRGKEAIEVGRARGEEIDLLITDMIMPEMSGRRVADELRSGRPDMRVLYMSGYTGDAMVHRGLLDPNASFIVKPFASRDLMTMVREILDAGRG